VAIVGHHLESGVRFVAERSVAEGPPWRYEGQAATHEACFHLVARLDGDGAVAVTLTPEPPEGLADKVRLIVRSAWKHAAEEGVAPPRRIARWRADR